MRPYVFCFLPPWRTNRNGVCSNNDAELLILRGAPLALMIHSTGGTRGQITTMISGSALPAGQDSL